MVTALVLVAVAAGFAFVRFHGYSAGDRTPVTNGPVPSMAASPAVSPAMSAAQPFAGSPAAGYADGAAGIVPPHPRAVGHYSARSVAAAYATVRKLLIAAYLDPRTLRGGSPDAFARLLIPQQRAWFVHGLDKTGVDSHGLRRSTRDDVVSFAPGTTRIAGGVIKVHGTMWAQQAHQDGQRVLRIRSSYLFVYPVERPGDTATPTRLVAHNYAAVDFADWDDSGGPLQAWLLDWPGDGTAGDRCDVNDGFVHPEFPRGAPDTATPRGPVRDPYSLSSPAPAHGCERTSGT